MYMCVFSWTPGTCVLHCSGGIRRYHHDSHACIGYHSVIRVLRVFSCIFFSAEAHHTRSASFVYEVLRICNMIVVFRVFSCIQVFFPAKAYMKLTPSHITGVSCVFVRLLLHCRQRRTCICTRRYIPRGFVIFFAFLTAEAGQAGFCNMAVVMACVRVLCMCVTG